MGGFSQETMFRCLLSLEICRLTRSLGLAIGEDSGIIAEPQVDRYSVEKCWFIKSYGIWIYIYIYIYIHVDIIEM